MNKTEALRVRITTAEGQAFKKLADDIGEPRSRLLRKMIREAINKDIDLLTDEKSLVMTATRQLMGIANNLNQITVAMHSGKAHRTIDENYLKELRTYVLAVKAGFDSHVKITRSRWVNGL